MIDLRISNKKELNELLDFLIDNSLVKDIKSLCEERIEQRKEIMNNINKKVLSSFKKIKSSPSTLEIEILEILKPSWIVGRHSENKWLILNTKNGKYCYVAYCPCASKNVKWKISNGIVTKRLNLETSDIVACFKQSPSYYEKG